VANIRRMTGPPLSYAAAAAPGAAAVGADDELTIAYRRYLAGHPSPAGGSLLGQTVAIAPVRQSFVPLVPLAPGWRVLDVGTGYGSVAFELAHRQQVSVTGVDVDPAVVAAAREIAAGLTSWLHPGATVAFRDGPAERLPCEDASFELATAALLLQHVPSAPAVVAELWRVVRPGGLVFAFDVDDGLGATFPRHSALDRLEDAFDAWQASYGGDRLIGRKLSVLFAQQGFEMVRLEVLPYAQHLHTAPGDQLRMLTAERLRAARTPIVARGFLDGPTFDQLLDEYEHGVAHDLCRIEGRVALVARKPATPVR
jgi:ubiquinone/menaquinone biosynthesis C-methylase UbiE